MKRLIMTLAAAAFFAAASYAAVSVTYYPLTLTANTDTVYITWDDGLGGPVASATMLYGDSSGNYTGTIAQTSPGEVNFIPSALPAPGMPGGVYYFRISNNADSSWSNEHKLIIGKLSGLNVSNIILSPNPFSPVLGGLTITYLPDSDDTTTVKITIKVYTMDGKLVRTIADGEMKTTGAVAISKWDGKTDMGYNAKNGRYIIQLEAHDSTGTKQYLNTVVMVK